MSNVNFELNLNKHPKACKDRSLVWAENVQLSDDLSCLQSEYSILRREDLIDSIFTSLDNNFEIVGCIPCNTELIFFVVNQEARKSLGSGAQPMFLFRWSETETIAGSNERGYIAYGNPNSTPQKGISWHGGKIKGTFTYNIQHHLIIAFSEYDIDDSFDINVPLKTIDLGLFNTDNKDDRNLSESVFSFNPIVQIPNALVSYVDGLGYKGYYHVFIRYKINENDYTKWYNIAKSIYVNEIKETKIFDYYLKYASGANVQVNGFGITDSFSDKTDICNKIISILLDETFIDAYQDKFNIAQIGVIINTKSSVKCFKSNDLSFYGLGDKGFIINVSNMEEYSVNEILLPRYNYYNVKNVTNYRNRLYISNFNEKHQNIDYSDIVDKINIELCRDAIELGAQINETPTEEFEGSYILRANYTFLNGGSTIYNELKEEILTKDNFDPNITYNLGYKHEIVSVTEIQVNISIIYKDTNNVEHVLQQWQETTSNDVKTIKETGICTNNVYNYITFFFNINTSIGIVPAAQKGVVKSKINISGIYDSPAISRGVKYDNASTFENRLKSSTLLPGNKYKFYVHIINKYGEISDGYLIDSNHITINDASFGEKDIDTNEVIIGNRQYINDGGIPKFYRYYLKSDVDGSLNSEYGYFISYEKYNSTVKFTGYLTGYDFNKNQQYLDDEKGFHDYNNDGIIKHKYRFYSSELDLYDNINFNLKKLRILASNNWINIPLNLNTTISEKDDSVYDYVGCAIENTSTASHTVEENNIQENIVDFKFIHAHSHIDNNDYRGAYLELTLENDINSTYFDSDNPALSSVKVELIGEDENLYNNENKVLIRLSDYYYDSDEHEILDGYNGHITFNNFLVYNNNKMIVNDGLNIIVNKKYYSYVDTSLFPDDTKMNSDIYAFPVIYVVMPVYSDRWLETKSFKVEPELILTREELINSSHPQNTISLRTNTIVKPINSSDLFEDRFGNSDALIPITYTNFKDKFIERFDKRVQRSNVIADESITNSWRIFNTEDYKDISENKGNIVNLTAMGLTMLIHTEHSLFMLSADDTFETNDKRIQLNTPDVFDITYKEVFSSNLGVCGIQDDEAFIIDEFGYIFYDNDAHSLYQFGNNKITQINGNIENFLNKYKPYKVRFANDKQSNRLLIKFEYFNEANNQTILVLSYNYIIGKFISTHKYTFDTAYNTKNLLYMIITKTISHNNISSVYGINNLINNKDSVNTKFIKNYNKFENLKEGTDANNIKFSIIVNTYPDLIKTLEFITYRLRKINHSTSTSANNFNSPVEGEYNKPYSGTTIRIYNEAVDTKEMDVTTEPNNINPFMNFKKPWYELGTWNFNYFRNNIDTHAANIGDVLSRIYGNYFIIEITCDCTNMYDKIEFEDLDVQLTNNPTI